MEALLTGGIAGGLIAIALGAIKLAEYKVNGKRPNSEVGFHVKELRRETADQTKVLNEMHDTLKGIKIGLDGR